jgi:hypothetical protein
MIKIGDGAKVFSQLDWVSAKAADVYAWAKAANINIVKDGSGNVVSGIEWDATANDGKGGIKFTTASVATSEGFEALSKDVDAIEKDIAENRAEWAKDTTYTITKTDKGFTFTPSDGNATSITFDYLTEAEIKALQVDDASHADAAAKVDNALTVKVGGADVVFDGSAAKTADVDTAIGAAKTELIGDANDTKDSDTITGAKIYADNSASTAAAGALNDAKGYVDQKFIDADLAQYTTEQEVKDIVDGVINSATDKETLDSLVELVEYIDTHSGDAINMATAIGTLEGKVDTIEKKPAYAITATQVSNWDNEVGAKALAETKLDAATYNTYVQDHANDYTNKQIDDAIDADVKAAIDAEVLRANGAYDAKGAASDVQAALIGQADDDKTKDTIIGARRYADSLAVNYATAAQGALANSALQEITTTANGGLKVTNKNQIDIDTDVVFVFNCGDSSEFKDK